MDNLNYEELIQRIVDSKSFGNSKTYENLLIYLVECTLTGDVPKETSIASEIFQKYSFDPSQSTLVRVYVYNLRKKLKQYYKKEGLEEDIILKIPTGGYKVEFIKRDQIEQAVGSSFNINWKVMISLLLFLSVVLNIYWGVKNGKSHTINDEGLWKDMLLSERPVMVMLGDLFTYSEFDSTLNLLRNIRDPNINSQDQFEEFKTKSARPGIHYQSVTYAYHIRSTVNWIRSLTEIFLSEDKDFSIRSISRFNAHELQEHEVIAIGMLKTLGPFNTYFGNSKFKFLPPNTITYQESESSDQLVYQPIGNPDAYHTDYGFMAKFPGPDNNKIYLFGGLWDTGTSQSLKNFTDQEHLKKLEQAMIDKFGSLPEYYEMLFEVSGIDRMELSTKILHINKVDDHTKLWDLD